MAEKKDNSLEERKAKTEEKNTKSQKKVSERGPHQGEKDKTSMAGDPTIQHEKDSKKVNKEEKIVQKLRQTIQEYVELRQTKQNSGEDCIVIDSLILTLEDQLAKILSGKNLKPPLRPKPKDQEQRKLKNKEKNQEKELTAEEKSKDPLMEIFEFYAKQQNNIIKAPLIEQLAQNYCILNLAKFMRFLKEFEIMDTINRKDRRTLDSNVISI